MSRFGICKSGENPGFGTYICTNCHSDVTLNENDMLPTCPSCSSAEFTEE